MRIIARPEDATDFRLRSGSIRPCVDRAREHRSGYASNGPRIRSPHPPHAVTIAVLDGAGSPRSDARPPGDAPSSRGSAAVGSRRRRMAFDGPGSGPRRATCGGRPIANRCRRYGWCPGSAEPWPRRSSGARRWTGSPKRSGGQAVERSASRTKLERRVRFGDAGRFRLSAGGCIFARQRSPPAVRSCRDYGSRIRSARPLEQMLQSPQIDGSPDRTSPAGAPSPHQPASTSCPSGLGGRFTGSGERTGRRLLLFKAGPSRAPSAGPLAAAAP